jgi:Pyridoxamine 5'-phosphate oxidase
VGDALATLVIRLRTPFGDVGAAPRGLRVADRRLDEGAGDPSHEVERLLLVQFGGVLRPDLRDEFRGRRASYVPDAVSQDVPWTMKGRLMEIINLGTVDGLPPVDWAAIVAKLAAGSAPAPDAVNSRTTWLSTVNEDGSPHVTAVGALWLDDAFWFQTGASTLKARNVARDSRCSIAVSIRDADVVVEGDAARVTEPGAVARIAKAWADQGWPAEPDDSGSGITAPFNAPSQGPPPWNVYRIEPRSALVTLAAEPGGLTRFRF